MQQYTGMAKSIKRKIKFPFENPLLKPQIGTSPRADDLSTQLLATCPLRPRPRARALRLAEDRAHLLQRLSSKYDVPTTRTPPRHGPHTFNEGLRISLLSQTCRLADFSATLPNVAAQAHQTLARCAALQDEAMRIRARARGSAISAAGTTAAFPETEIEALWNRSACRRASMGAHTTWPHLRRWVIGGAGNAN